MYSIQEMLSHTEEQRKAVRTALDGSGSHYPFDANIYNNQKRSIQRELRESIRAIPLREFLVSGLAGAAYLVPDKLSDILYQAATQVDIVPLISMDVIDGWEGGVLKIDVVNRLALRAGPYGAGGSKGPRTMVTAQPTITPIAFSCPLIANSEIIEDAQWNLVEWYVREAARGMAWLAADMALTVLKTATDGIGTLNESLTGDSAETKWTGGVTADVIDAMRALGDDEWVPNTMVVTNEAFLHSIAATASTVGVFPIDVAEGFDIKMMMMDVLFCNNPALHAAGDAVGATFTECVTLFFDRRAALITGRKRWLQIDNYADPVADLEGAVVSARQDSVTAYDDSIYKLTETA